MSRYLLNILCTIFDTLKVLNVKLHGIPLPVDNAVCFVRPCIRCVFHVSTYLFDTYANVRPKSPKYIDFGDFGMHCYPRS